LNTDGDYPILNILLQAAPTLGLGSTTVLIILIAILLLLTALVAGSEVAFFSLSASDLSQLKTKNKGVNKTIIHLLEQPKKLLATLLIANNFLSIGIIVTTNVIVKSLVNFETIIPGNIGLAQILNLLVQVVLVTFLLVLFGEVLPKVYATQNNMRMSMLCAPFINFLHKLVSPISNLLVRSSALIEKNIRNKPSEISDKDVENAIQLTVGHSATKEEVNIFKGILRFGDITVKQIMKGRLDVSGVAYGITFKELQQQVLSYGYSRIPVYENSLDTIKGLLHTKDLLPYTETPPADWHELIRPALYVHESKLIEDLRMEFQKKKMHFAVIVDEFGGTSGIVTLEDIMEEIIGEIKDEFDEDDNEIKKINDTTFICEGKTPINDVARYLGVPIETFDEARGESDSIGGLWLEIAGTLPKIGGLVSLPPYTLMVMEVQKNRIEKVKLTIDNTPVDIAPAS
jgi:putative hemolysin